MRHVSRTHRVALDWLFDRINLDSKIQIKYIDTENQLANILTKGNFTRDEWNHLLCLLNISHFSSTVCSDTMAKRSQQDSGGERVTAKSRPMMNLIARTPSHVSSSTSVSPGKRSYGSQDPWSSIAKEYRSGRPDKGTDLFEASDHHFQEQFMENFSSASYSKWDDDRAWSFQEWKTETTTHDRSGRPDKTSWRMVRKVRPDHEEILFDGTAQSVRNGETLCVYSGSWSIDKTAYGRKSLPNHHENHIAGKGDNSLQHYNLVHTFIPMPQAMKIPAAKAAVDKEREKLENISTSNLTKVRNKSEVIDEARTSGAKVHFASLMDVCHLKNAELEAKHQKYKG